MAYKGALMVNDEELYNSFARCAHLGTMPLLHAENDDVVARVQEALLKRDISSPEGHRGRRRSRARPPTAIMIADMTGAPLYVAHELPPGA